MKKVLFVVHGRLQNSQRWKRISQQIANQSQWSCETVYTEYPAHAIELVRSNLEKAKFDAVVACGGDGTLNECVNGIMLAKSNVAVGILSLGTGNDFVKSLRIQGSWNDLLEAIETRNTLSCDVMRLKSFESLRYGINVSDIGIGGEVVQRMARDRRWLGSFLTYQKNIIMSFLSFKSKEVILKFDDEPEFSTNLFMFAMSNASWFGSGLCIDPEAQLNDGLLNVVMVRDISLIDYFGQLKYLRRGYRMQHGAVTYRQCQEVNLISPGWPIDCDGEFIGHTPLSMNIIEGAINILLPKTIAKQP
jgi:diacylglycerol kinase (ATP)